MWPQADIHGLFFAAHSHVEVVLRLLLAWFALRGIGFLFSSRIDLVPSERALLGVGAGLGLWHIGSFLPGRPGLLPTVLWTAAIAGWVWEWSAHGARSVRAVVAATVQDPSFWGSVALLGLAVFAEWPRLFVLDNDLAQHVFFVKETLAQGRVPQDLLPLGPEPFHYPAGTGVVGAVLSVLSLGLKPLEVSQLMPGFCMWLVYRALLEKGGRSAWIHVAFLSALCWGHVMPTRLHASLGRALLFPWVLWMLWNYAARVRSPGSGSALLALLFLSCPLILSLNAAIAPVPVAIGLMALARHWSKDSFIRARVALALGTLSLVAVLAVDPYFRGFLLGNPAHNYLLEGLEAARAEVDVLRGLRRLFTENPRDLLYQGNLSVVLALALTAALTAPRARRRSAWARVGVFALVVAIVGWAVRSVSLSSDVGPLTLIGPYNQLLVAHLGMAFFALELGSNLLAARSPLSRRSFATLAAIFAIAGVFGFVSKALFRREMRMDAGLAAVLRELAARPDSPRFIIENRAGSPSGERWLVARDFLGLAAYLPNTQPGWFYFRGDRAFGYSAYFARVCDRLDVEGLRRQGFEAVLVGPHSPCPALPKSSVSSYWRF
jgi:hypothetical protein